jgi:hypothetical protein
VYKKVTSKNRRQTPPPEAPLEARVQVNDEQVHKVAEKISTLSELDISQAAGRRDSSKFGLVEQRLNSELGGKTYG